jgi:REP element-mobilizing transposase RayT
VSQGSSKPTDRPKRGHPSHGVLHVADQPTIIFDTVCTKDRKGWLANDAVHELLQDVWRQADAWLMGRYVIMPDLIHFFAGFAGSDIDHESWVKYWKSQFTKRYQNARCDWLTGHWDTRMRSASQYEEKWHYVELNPVRHGLVERAEDWLFKGQIHLLPWD